MNLLEEIRHTFNRSDNAVRRIIIINVSVFIVFALLNVINFFFRIDGGFLDTFRRYLELPASLSTLVKQPWSILSYMFLHDGVLHILFNMLWLFWIGNILHEYLGNRKVYEAYIAGGVFGGLIYILSYNLFPVFHEVVPVSFALGASAGVLSVVAATATLLPDYSINLLFFGAVRLKYLALITLVLDLISIPSGNAGGHIAHLGGALFGFFYIKYIYRRGSLIPDSWLNIFSKRSKVKIHYRTTYARPEEKNKPSQEEIDAILDKISKSGYDSLSKREKEILFKASKE